MDEEKECDRSNETQFSKDYHEYLGIIVSELLESDKKIPYVNEKPGFVIAWLKQFLENNMKEEKCMLECSFADIKPESYSLEVVDDKELKLSLTFNFDDEEEDFKLNGKLVHSKEGKVGVEW